MTYPWAIGDALLAADLNAAIANAGNTNTFNALNHGVTMDGVTDDRAALAALSALAGATPGSVIYFPPSPTPLMLSSDVNIPSNQTWWAYPGSVTIKTTPGNVGTVMLLGAASSDNIHIHGLTFDGGGQDFPNTNAVTQFYHINRLTLTQVTFQNTRGLPFNGSGVNDLLVRDCTFKNIGNRWKTTGVATDYAQALTVGGYGDPAWGHRIRVEGCDFSDCGSDCINFGELTDIIISNNVFTQVLTPYTTLSSPAWFAGIFMLFCDHFVIDGNIFNGMTGNAIDLPAMWDGVISNNFVRNSGQGGIGLFDGSGYSLRTIDPRFPAPRGSRNITITGNVVEDSGNWTSSVFRSGITVGASTVAASNIRIANNLCTDTRASGKTQQYGVLANASPAPVNVWVDPSNGLAGNAVGAVSGLASTTVMTGYGA